MKDDWLSLPPPPPPLASLPRLSGDWRLIAEIRSPTRPHAALWPTHLVESEPEKDEDEGKKEAALCFFFLFSPRGIWVSGRFRRVFFCSVRVDPIFRTLNCSPLRDGVSLVRVSFSVLFCIFVLFLRGVFCTDGR